MVSPRKELVLAPNPADGIDVDDFNVSKLLAWVERESGKSSDRFYEMSRVVAGSVMAVQVLSAVATCRMNTDRWAEWSTAG
jgi:hypothetical protein